MNTNEDKEIKQEGAAGAHILMQKQKSKPISKLTMLFGTVSVALISAYSGAYLMQQHCRDIEATKVKIEEKENKFSGLDNLRINFFPVVIYDRKERREENLKCFVVDVSDGRERSYTMGDKHIIIGAEDEAKISDNSSAALRCVIDQDYVSARSNQKEEVNNVEEVQQKAVSAAPEENIIDADKAINDKDINKNNGSEVSLPLTTEENRAPSSSGTKESTPVVSTQDNSPTKGAEEILTSHDRSLATHKNIAVNSKVEKNTEKQVDTNELAVVNSEEKAAKSEVNNAKKASAITKKPDQLKENKKLQNDKAGEADQHKIANQPDPVSTSQEESAVI